MIRSVSREHLAAIRDLLARANETPYDIAHVAEEKCFGVGLWGAPIVRVAGDFAGIAVTSGQYLRLLAVDRAARRRGLGSALLRDAEERGARVAAAEPGNYFTPGVIESDRATISFLTYHGYRRTTTTQNLVTGSLPERIPPGVGEAEPNERLLRFVERHFGPAWRLEASRAPTLFYVEDDNEIAAFSAHDANNHGLGFFGPTGVVESMRRRGYGRLLLQASLADLRRRGYRQVVIPWTDAIAFYERSCDARVQARFIGFTKA